LYLSKIEKSKHIRLIVSEEKTEYLRCSKKVGLCDTYITADV
jgi:hypothetical protein